MKCCKCHKVIGGPIFYDVEHRRVFCADCFQLEVKGHDGATDIPEGLTAKDLHKAEEAGKAFLARMAGELPGIDCSEPDPSIPPSKPRVIDEDFLDDVLGIPKVKNVHDRINKVLDSSDGFEPEPTSSEAEREFITDCLSGALAGITAGGCPKLSPPMAWLSQALRYAITLTSQAGVLNNPDDFKHLIEGCLYRASSLLNPDKNAD